MSTRVTQDDARGTIAGRPSCCRFGDKIGGVGLEGLGRLLVGGALVLLVLGGLFLLLGRIGLDRLPGDLVFRRGNLTVYFPIGLMILLSIVGTIALNVLLRR